MNNLHSIDDNNLPVYSKEDNVANKQTPPQERKIPRRLIAASADGDQRASKETAEYTKKMLASFQKDAPSQRLEQAQRELVLDPAFLCSDAIFAELCPKIEYQLQIAQNFDAAGFLRGSKGMSPEALQTNQTILNEAAKFIRLEAKALAAQHPFSLEHSYKWLIGSLDNYDDAATSLYQSSDPSISVPKSTFILRSAVLLASQADGVNIHSWMAYTKSGKPEDAQKWVFLDNWKNWVPEAQGSMVKFSEKTFIQAKNLSMEHPENKIVLLKGGFGAGKTRLAGQLMGDSAEGIVAPDLAKRVVRRSLETFTHASAHIQGLQIAYRLFNEMINRVVGTIVYDSSLSSPEDVKNYLNKSIKAGKKLVIYDVARHDMARILAVLKRPIEGDDPRIPPSFIISSAIRDKMNRTACMEEILQFKLQKGQESPEYHFIGGDSQGWNTDEMMVITPQNIQKMHPEMLTRLSLEGIVVDVDNNTITSRLIESDLQQYFVTQFERPVKDIIQELSFDEQQILLETFSNRTLPLLKPVHDTRSFYEALPDHIQSALPQGALEEAFNSLKPKTKEQFFNSISSDQTLSYLDLPLHAALVIHQNLLSNPWQKTSG